MPALHGKRSPQPFCFTGLEPGRNGMDEYPASKLIDVPGLTPVLGGASGAGDIGCEGPHGGEGSVGADVTDPLADEGTGSRHDGEGTPDTCAEKSAAGRGHI